MYIILSQDAKSSLRLQCNIAGNASEVAVPFYTMALKHVRPGCIRTPSVWD